VFKVAVFRFDASLKTSSSLLDCRVNHGRSLVKFVPCRHNALMQLANVLDSMLVDPFLHHRPDCVVHWTQVRTVQWPQYGRNESSLSDVSAFSNSTVSRARCNV